MPYEVHVEQHASQPLAVVRRRASIAELPKVIPAACGEVWNLVRARNIAGAGRHIAVYWDGDINLEIGVELAAPIASSDGLLASATPAGPVATTVHFGPYQRLGAAHEAIQAWCQQNGRALAGPSWEIYGHWKDEWNNDPSQIRTDVFYLLRG
jgi:effector-binding domain-containing protein